MAAVAVIFTPAVSPHQSVEVMWQSAPTWGRAGVEIADTDKI